MARKHLIPAIIALFAIIQAAMCATTPSIPDVKTFFAKSINGNLTKITWAHAVNSQAKLQDALGNEKIMMLEADVVLGVLNDTVNATQKIPIMGHPPAAESDLSLEEFLESVLANGKRGIKLDFKSIEAFNGSVDILKKYRANLTVPVWLNADILYGPVDAEKQKDTPPVEAHQFLVGAADVLPDSTLSVGWTTRYGSKENITKGSYTLDQVQKMTTAVADSKTKQSITYPVRAGLAANAAPVLETLLKQTTANNPTLTIWSSEGDVVDVAALSKLIKDVGVDKVYVDVPEDLWAKLDLKSGAPSLSSSMMLIGSIIASLAIIKLV